MRVYRELYTDKTGKRQRTSRWYVDFTDHYGRRHRIPGFSQKPQTETLGRNIEILIASRISGQSFSPEIELWIKGLPLDLRRKLGAWGLIDGRRVEACKTLDKHLEDYKAVLQAQGRSQGHIAPTISRIAAVLEDCGFRYIEDVSGSKVTTFLGKLRQAKKSALTRNHYLTAMKMFIRWMICDGRAISNPIAYLKPEKTDARQRGALTHIEFEKLVKETFENREKIHRMTGRDRAMLYLLAGFTGLRRSEIISLRWSNLSLEGEMPFVCLDGSKTKNRQAARQPFPPQVAGFFLLWKASRRCQENDKVFPTLTPSSRPSIMIEHDLIKAGIGTCDHEGRKFDFHSLRNTYVSFLAASNLPPKLVQQLARHSTPSLTFNTYARVSIENERNAVNALPVLNFCEFGGIPREENRSIKPVETHGDGKTHSAIYSAKLASKTYINQHLDAQLPGESKSPEMAVFSAKTPILRENEGEREMGRGGFEPPTHGFSVHCSTN